MLKSPKLMLSAAVVLGALCVVSCDKVENIPNESGTQGMLKLGKQLENPYSVENMKQAWNNLQENNSSYRMMGDGISTTHLYLKFKPQNEDELNLLQQDSTLNLYTYPLDHEILGEGDYYQDPETPDSLPTYQYCAVPVDKVLPGGVSYEVLAELFIPDEDPDDDEGQRFASEEVTDALVDEALRITDNLEPEETHENQRMARKWRPAGKVKVWDDAMNKNIGLHGVKVRARRWFTTRTGITNSAGVFSCNGKFRRKANYSIKWERKYYDIRNGLWGQAFYNGPKKKGNWNLTITRNKSLRFATIHRAAHRHYYGNNLGISRPVDPNSKTKICYFNTDNGIGDYWSNIDATGVLPDIRIFGKSNNNTFYSTTRIFRTAIHELGHASHCVSMGNIQFFQVSKIIYESWADAVEYFLTKQEYLEMNHTINVGSKQGWSTKPTNFDEDITPYYTPLFIDIIDNYNQREENSGNTNYPNDNVTGYNLQRLNYLVHQSYGLHSLKLKLKENKPNGVTDQDIDDLLEIFFNL